MVGGVRVDFPGDVDVVGDDGQAGEGVQKLCHLQHRRSGIQDDPVLRADVPQSFFCDPFFLIGVDLGSGQKRRLIWGRSDDGLSASPYFDDPFFLGQAVDVPPGCGLGDMNLFHQVFDGDDSFLVNNIDDLVLTFCT